MAAEAHPKPDPLSVWCTYCGARRGRPCIPDGLPCSPRKKPHAARVRAAEREERGEEKEREAHIAEISTRETLNDD